MLRRLAIATMLGSLWLAATPAGAQTAAKAAQLAARIEAREGGFLPDDKVPTSRASLFRGELLDARRALEELATLGADAIPQLTRLLGAKSAHLRANAAFGLGLVGGPRTAAVLVGAAADTSAAVRYQVTLALGNTCSPLSLAALNNLAGDGDDLVRNTAIQTSAALRDVLAAEQETTPDNKINALVRLAYAPPACSRLVAYGAQAVPALIAALDDKDRGVVAGAAATLARIGDPRGLEPLWNKLDASLKSEPPAPELKFAQALGGFRSQEVWPYLLKLVELDNPAIALSGLQRMAEYPHPERADVLNKYLQKQIEKGVHREPARGSEMQVNAVASVCEVLALVGDKSSLGILKQVIDEAPPADKSIVKPMALKAKAAIEQRG